MASTDKTSTPCTAAASACKPQDPSEASVKDGPAGWVARAFDILNADPPEAHRLATAAKAAADPDSSLRGRARHALGMSVCMLSRFAKRCAT